MRPVFSRGNISTPWTEYLAGVAGVASTWWASNVNSYLGYQNTLAGDQEGESIAAAQAAQTEGDAQADADHTLAYAQADADHTRAIDDDAAQQAEQASDAANDRAYQPAMAQAAIDFLDLVPDFGAASNADQNDTAAAQQSYLSAECAAQDSLTSANGADALTDFTTVAKAQLAWTVSGDSATEGYLYSTALAGDQQSDLDAPATAGYQATSAASYAAVIQAFDQASPSPWADYASAMASAQSTLTSTSASALSGEQIAVADADFAQTWADAVAEQGLDDAQATAATNLSIAQQTAESGMAVAQAIFDNMVSFQPGRDDQLLPEQLQWFGYTPLTAWESPGNYTSPRAGVTLPLAWDYQAGFSSASGFGPEALSQFAFAAEFPNFVGNDDSWMTLATLDGVSVEETFQGWSDLVPESPADLLLSAVTFDSQNLADGTAVVGGRLAPYPGVPAPNDFLVPSGVGSLWQMLNEPQFVIEAPPSAAAPLTAPVPDDTADQDPLDVGDGVEFDDTPLAQESDQSQPAPDTTPTAAVQEQQVQQQAAADAATANETALQAAVQTVMLGADVNAIPVSRIQLMWENGLASYYNPDPNHIDKNYAYVADAQGNNIVVYVFKRADKPVIEDASSAHDGSLTLQTVYSLIYTYTVNSGDSAMNVEQMLQDYRKQNKEDSFFKMAFDQEKLNASKAYQGKLEFTLNLIPFGSAADNFTQAAQAQNSTARQKFLIEGSISLAGDIATLASFGVGTVTKSATVIRNVRVGAALVDGVSGGVRAAQGVVALYNGDDGAMGYFGEATLMLMGASSSLIAEVRAARLAKQLGNAADAVPESVVRGLFGNFEYKVADPVKASAFKESLLEFYNKTAERPSIRWVDDLPGNRNGMIDTVTGEILLNNDLRNRFPQLAEGVEVEELLHFKQISDGDLLGKYITGAQERAMENQIEEIMTQNGFKVFDPLADR